MLIDWLPSALKRFYRLSSTPAPRDPRRTQRAGLINHQIENLEERQLLSGTNGFDYNVAVPNPNYPLDPLLISFANGTVSNAQATGNGNTTQSGTATVTDISADLIATDQYGRVGVRIIGTNINGLQSSLQPLGFVATGVRPDLNFVEGFIPQSRLTQLSSLTGLGLIGVVPMAKAQTNAGPTTNPAGNGLDVDRVLATLPPGYDGTGVTVGIISDSFNSNSASLPALANGDLPISVNVLLDGEYGNADEGRAMAELVHDLAPGASLAFASAMFGQASFAQQIRNLANPSIGGADIIVDDIIYFDEPMFQDGVIAQAVNDVVNINGVAYFSAAGNMADQSYEIANPTFATDDTLAPGDFLDFATSTGTVDIRNTITLNSGDSLILQLNWDDPFYTLNGVDTDLDIFAVDTTTGAILASSTSNNIATQTPSERLAMSVGGFGSTTVDIVVRLTSGPVPGRVKWVDFGNHSSSFSYDTQSSTVFGHAAANGAMSVAAAPYFDPRNVESFSAKGGTTILFSPTGAALGAPEVRQTPDITAIDGTNTSFFTGDYLFLGGSDVENDGLPNFFGTSAAAPHAAAVAALIRQANPGFTAQQIYDRMTSTAIDIGAPGVDNFTGHGLIDAYAAIFGSPVYAEPNFSDSFETGALSGSWSTDTYGNGTITIESGRGATDGSRSLVLGSRFDEESIFNGSSFDGQSEATLHLDLSGVTDDVYLSFDAKQTLPPTSSQFYNGQDPMSPIFAGSESSDGVAISVDGGTIWRSLVSFADTQIDNNFRSYKFNLSQLAATAGYGLGNNVMIKFQQYDLYYLTNPIVIDHVQVFTNTAPELEIGNTPVDYPINAPGILFAENATLNDTQALNYDGGSIVVAIATGASVADRVEIQNQALIPNRVPTPNDITLSGNRVLFGGLQIGTFIGGSGQSPLTISLNSNATRLSVQYLLQALTFRTTSGQGTPRTLSVTVDNGTGGAAATDTRQINVIAGANQSPVITMSPTSLNVQPGSSATVLDGSTTLTDPDSVNFQGGVMTIQITRNASTTYDRLEIRNEGNGVGKIGFSGSTIRYGGVVIGTLSGGTTSRTITFNSSATVAAVQALLRNITFRSISTSAPLATRTVQIRLTDGDGGTSQVATKLVNVVRRNQSPTLAGTSTIPNYFLGMNPVIVEPLATVSDPDNSNFAGGRLTVRITGNGTAFDRLSVRNQGSNVGQIAVSNGTNILYGGILIGTLTGGQGSTSPLEINLNANATPAAVRALMRNVTFQTTSPLSTTSTLNQRTITFQLADGQGGVSNTVAKTVRVRS